MARLTGNTSLRSEDYPSESGWIGGLFLSLNQLIQQLNAILNGGTLFGDNITGQTKIITISPGTALPVNFKYELVARPVELRICKATKNDAPVILACSWQLVNETLIELTSIVEIAAATDVTALDSAATYNLTVRVQP